MNHDDRKARIRDYKRTPQPAGIYRVRNKVSGRALIGATMNLEGRLNRHRFQLKTGTHPIPELQADWNRHGPDAFEFTVLDTLKPRDEPSHDPRDELGVLEELWLEKLGKSGVALYGR